MTECNISIIMPIYNASDSVRKAISSVLRQTVDNLEILCVDDGSTDSTLSILYEMAETNSKIRVFTQDHKGAGPARNMGIVKAEGKYVAFLDSDDEYVDSDALESMIESCEKNNAQVCGSFRMISGNGQDRDSGLLRDYVIPEHGCFLKYSDFQYDYDYQSFIFRKSLLVENNIVFPPYMRYQDPPFFIKAMTTAGQFYVIPKVLYKYSYSGLKHTLIVRYLDQMLMGIYDSVEMAVDNQYDHLLDMLFFRINEEYRDIIMNNMSESVLRQLLRINEKVADREQYKVNLIDYMVRAPKTICRLAESHFMLEKILFIRNSRYDLKSFFDENNIKEVAVYGIGKFGKILIRELEQYGINILYCVDREVQEYGGLRIIKPDDVFPQCDALIVSLLNPEDVISQVKMKTDNHIISFRKIVDDLAEMNGFIY